MPMSRRKRCGDRHNRSGERAHVLPVRFGEQVSVAGMIGAVALLGRLRTALSLVAAAIIAAAIVGLSAAFILPAGLAVLPASTVWPSDRRGLVPSPPRRGSISRVGYGSQASSFCSAAMST
jgi:hypothetical protein